MESFWYLLLAWVIREIVLLYRILEINIGSCQQVKACSSRHCFVFVAANSCLIKLKPGFHLQQTPRPRHKKQSNYCLSSHPSHWSLCFDSKLVVVVVEIGFMETRPNRDLTQQGRHRRGQRLRQCDLIDCITVFQSEFVKSFISFSALVEFTRSLHFFAT